MRLPLLGVERGEVRDGRHGAGGAERARGAREDLEKHGARVSMTRTPRTALTNAKTRVRVHTLKSVRNSLRSFVNSRNSTWSPFCAREDLGVVDVGVDLEQRDRREDAVRDQDLSHWHGGPRGIEVPWLEVREHFGQVSRISNTTLDVLNSKQLGRC